MADNRGCKQPEVSYSNSSSVLEKSEFAGDRNGSNNLNETAYPDKNGPWNVNNTITNNDNGTPMAPFSPLSKVMAIASTAPMSPITDDYFDSESASPLAGESSTEKEFAKSMPTLYQPTTSSTNTVGDCNEGGSSKYNGKVSEIDESSGESHLSNYVDSRVGNNLAGIVISSGPGGHFEAFEGNSYNTELQPKMFPYPSMHVKTSNISMLDQLNKKFVEQSCQDKAVPEPFFDLLDGPIIDLWNSVSNVNINSNKIDVDLKLENIELSKTNGAFWHYISKSMSGPAAVVSNQVVGEDANCKIDNPYPFSNVSGLVAVETDDPACLNTNGFPSRGNRNPSSIDDVDVDTEPTHNIDINTESTKRYNNTNRNNDAFAPLRTLQWQTTNDSLCKKDIFSATKPQITCYDTLTKANNSFLKSVGNLKSTKLNIQKSLLKSKNNVRHVTENNKRKNLAQTKNSQFSSTSDFTQPNIPLTPNTSSSNQNNAVNDVDFGKYISISRA